MFYANDSKPEQSNLHSFLIVVWIYNFVFLQIASKLHILKFNHHFYLKDQRFNKSWVVGHCVVTLFKAKVISRVNVEYRLPDFRIQYVTFLKSGIHTMYCVKWKMTLLFLTYRFKIVISYTWYLWIIIYFALIYIIYIYYFKICLQLNSIITCYVCVWLIKFIYKYIFIYVLCRIKFY